MREQNKNNSLGIEFAIWAVAFAINPKVTFMLFIIILLLFMISERN